MVKSSSVVRYYEQPFLFDRFSPEWLRVLVHGVLHYGYVDATDEENPPEKTRE